MPKTLIFFALMGVQATALAYIGPGLGAGTLSVVLGIVASIFLALFAIIWYPVKRFFKKRKAKSTEPEQPVVREVVDGNKELEEEDK